MIITREMLVEKGAYCEGLELFDKLAPSGELVYEPSELAQRAVIQLGGGKYWGWLVARGILPTFSMAGWNFRDANLSYADLSRANLSGADLSRADLRYADLRCANLSCADLYNADLSDANLSDANLSGANLSGANLYNAYLSDANLYNAYLRCANLRCAKYNTKTNWPEDVDVSMCILVI